MQIQPDKLIGMVCDRSVLFAFVEGCSSNFELQVSIVTKTWYYSITTKVTSQDMPKLANAKFVKPIPSPRLRFGTYQGSEDDVGAFVLEFRVDVELR